MAHTDSMRRVIVDQRYTYETDLELEVGDEVLLPASWSGEWIGRVTALSSDYGGPCKRIVRVVRRRQDADLQVARMAAVPVAGFAAGARVEISASCGHRVPLHVQEVNKIGRPTHITYRCEACPPVRGEPG